MCLKSYLSFCWIRGIISIKVAALLPDKRASLFILFGKITNDEVPFLPVHHRTNIWKLTHANRNNMQSNVKAWD